MNLALRDIQHQLPRFLATAGGLGLLLTIVLAMGGIYQGMVEEAVLLIDRTGADLWIVQESTKGPFAERSSVPLSLEDRARTTPGVEIMPEPRNHNHIIYRDVRVPLDHLLGPEDGAKVLAQRRLGGGRIHHAMRTIAQCQLALDMMCERALTRRSHGQVIAEHQMVQDKIAESYVKLKMLRLLVLEAAWKIDRTSTQEARTEIAAVKFTMSRVLREISFDALHIHGSLGTTDLTPLQDMYAAAPHMGLADGPDEVHKATVARRILKSYRPHDGNFPREFRPYKEQAAREKMQPVLDANPELAKAAENYRRYFAGRRG